MDAGGLLSSYIVLDDSTGDSTIVFGKPVASPYGTRFVLPLWLGLEQAMMRARSRSGVWSGGSRK
jgi:hypothetical protein